MADQSKCKRCGSKMHRLFALPEVNDDHYNQAREAAEFVWTIASKQGNPISVVCLTAGLLIKRAAMQLGVPHDAQPTMAAYYIQVVREIIYERRRQAAEEREAN